MNQPRDFLLFFDPIRFISVQLSLSTLFSLPDATSHLTNIVTPLRCVTLPSHKAKMNALSLFHLPATLHPIVSPLEPK
jgi:hypothetical protein